MIGDRFENATQKNPRVNPDQPEHISERPASSHPEAATGGEPIAHISVEYAKCAQSVGLYKITFPAAHSQARHSMVRAINLSIALCFVAACQRPPNPAQWPTLASPPPEAVGALRHELSRSELVFVGRLVAADTGWTGYTGALVMITKAVTFNVLDILKGSPPPKTLILQYIMFSREVWVEEHPSGGIRLDPRFFVRGSEYIVLASRIPEWEDDDFYIMGEAGEGVWLNTPENLAGIKALLRESSAGGTPHPTDVP